MKPTLLLLLLGSFSQTVALGQTNLANPTGTYRGTGKTCTISIEHVGKKLSVNVFAWWGNQLTTHGDFDGTCTLIKGRCVVKAIDAYAGTGCQPVLVFGKPSQLTAAFPDCGDVNIPPDFDGAYVKVTDLTIGDFSVATDRSYFYEEREEKTKRKAYVLRGDVLDVQVIYDATWGYAMYTTRTGKSSSGYVKLNTLRAQ